MTAWFGLRGLCRCALAVAFVATSFAAVAQGNSSGITFKVSHRHPDGAWSRLILDGETVLNQMVRNTGPDDTLMNFRWEDLDSMALWASAAIKREDDRSFKDQMAAIEKSMGVLTTREANLSKLRAAIASELDIGVNRWYDLLEKADVLESLGIVLATKGAGMAGSSMLVALGENISSNLVTGAGKLLGPASTAFGIYTVYLETTQYADLKVLSPRLLEMVEIVAFLDVLLWNYDYVIDSHQTIIDVLMIEYSNYENQICKRREVLHPGKILSAFYPKTIISDGVKEGIQLSLSGEFEFPVTANLKPKSCPFGINCGTETRVIAAMPGNGRHFLDEILWCQGVSSPWAMDYEIHLVDAIGYKSNSVAVVTSCVKR